MNCYPTGTCFNDVLDYLDCIVHEGCSRDELYKFTVVHGILSNPNSDNELYAHAWLEKDNHVLHSGIVNDEMVMITDIPRDEYYRDMGVVECVKYSIPEMLRENAKHENYGPWIQRYRDLCKDAATAPKLRNI